MTVQTDILNESFNQHSTSWSTSGTAQQQTRTGARVTTYAGGTTIGTNVFRMTDVPGDSHNTSAQTYYNTRTVTGSRSTSWSADGITGYDVTTSYSTGKSHSTTFSDSRNTSSTMSRNTDVEMTTSQNTTKVTTVSTQVADNPTNTTVTTEKETIYTTDGARVTEYATTWDT